MIVVVVSKNEKRLKTVVVTSGSKTVVTGFTKIDTVVFAVKVNRTASRVTVEASSVDEITSILVEIAVDVVASVGKSVKVVRDVKENRSVTVNVMG